MDASRLRIILTGPPPEALGPLILRYTLVIIFIQSPPGDDWAAPGGDWAAPGGDWAARKVMRR